MRDISLVPRKTAAVELARLGPARPVARPAMRWRVRAEMVDERERRIVVGIDGSGESKAALRWAVQHACRIGAIVDAVTAWQRLNTVGYAATPFAEEQVAVWAGQALSDCVAESEDPRQLDPGQKVEVRQSVVRGDRATVLLDAARGADLLVLGTSGRRNQLVPLRLRRSVASQCAGRAPCPVVLVG